MARCISCNGVFSEFYLKDGVCEDCLEKHESIKSNLSDSEKKEIEELNKRFNKIDVYKFFQLKETIQSLKNKYNVEISLVSYLTIENLLIPYLKILYKKRNELVITDAYGNEKYEALNNEIKYFIENTFLKLLKENNVDVSLDFIHSYIFEKIKVDGKTYVQEILKKEAASKTDSTVLGLIIIIVLFLIVIFTFKSCSNKPNAYEQVVTNYLKKELNNPKSYESISFKNLVDNPNLVLIKHEYIATNSYNALIRTSEYFFISKKDNEVTSTIQNRIANTFLKLLENEYHDRNTDNIFMMFGINRANLLMSYNRGENAISEFCKTTAKFSLDAIQERVKELPPRYIDVDDLNILLTYCNLLPNEMTEVIKDSLGK